ncbi:MAG TPA: bifunctional nuclease family protein [Bacteroidales bacterium]|nr:bifunctional nuclease family protein [Bacteroidales bacterium]HRR04265.1 bifunctional nuclease family protein [Bacteroidales bacterium]HRT13485.1 bifunctional nuclease family protein [Bacteroidales bacterium]
MEHIELIVSDIQSSQTQGEAFVLLLKEKSGERFVPIVIGIGEARAVVFELNKIQPHRPGPHDLFQQLIRIADFQFKKVVIWKFEAGVFFANLYIENREGEEIIIDARTSDAVTLSLKFETPIFMDKAVFEKTAIISKTKHAHNIDEKQENGDEVEAYDHFVERKLEEMSNSELQNLLEGAVDSEDFELASKIHEEIKKREAS